MSQAHCAAIPIRRFGQAGHERRLLIVISIGDHPPHPDGSICACSDSQRGLLAEYVLGVLDVVPLWLLTGLGGHLGGPSLRGAKPCGAAGVFAAVVAVITNAALTLPARREGGSVRAEGRVALEVADHLPELARVLLDAAGMGHGVQERLALAD